MIMAKLNNWTVDQVMDEIRERLRHRRIGGELRSIAEIDGRLHARPPLYDLTALRRETAESASLHNAVGSINPRPPGIHNALAQLAKKILRRILTWYTRPLHAFHASNARALAEQYHAMLNLQELSRLHTVAIQELAEQTASALKKLEQLALEERAKTNDPSGSFGGQG